MQCSKCKEELTKAYVNATVFFDIDDNGDMSEASVEYEATDACCSKCDITLRVDTSDGDMRIAK